VDQLSQAVAEMHTAAAELAAAIDRDAQSYDAVLAAFKLPKETPDEQRQRDAAIQQATRGAAEVPMTVARKAAEIFDRLGQLEAISSASMSSDLRVARLMAAAGARGALANVAINLDSITDASFVAAMCKQAAEIESRLTANAARA
ncbi:MAG: cyclodeaminase/cyclohydrolase family protein, partial [Candidatus Acidiferrales bacterium]